MEKRITNHLVQKNPADCITRSQVQHFLSLGDLLGWEVQVFGQAPMLTQAVRVNDWLLVPAHEDSSKIPLRTLRRIRTIFAEGLRPQGFVVVHEAPMQLPAPTPVDNEPVRKLITLGESYKVAGALSGFLAIGLGILVLGGMLLPLGLLAGVALVDPILVAVTEDGYWVEIDRWQA
jgi:hypothetical protein